MSRLTSSLRDHLRVVPYDKDLLEASREWLLDEELRRLIRARKYTEREQAEWFQSISSRSDYLIWGLTLKGRPIGVLGLKNIEPSVKAEYFAFIGPKELWGQGIGRFMHEAVVEAGKKLGLKYLFGFAGNERTKRAHLKYGWKLSGSDDAGALEIRYDLRGPSKSFTPPESQESPI